VTNRLTRAAAKITEKIQTALQSPATKAANKAQVKEEAKKSVFSLLEKKKAEIAQRDAERRSRRHMKQNVER